MGLLQRALLHYSRRFQNRGAIETSVLQEGIEFYHYAEEAGLGPCAVFTQVDGVYCIKQSFGFTAETIVKSVSSSDFWDGIFWSADDGDWLIKKDEGIASFRQFFSEYDREKLESLMLKRFSLGDGSAAIWMGFGGIDEINAADALIDEIITAGIDFPITDFAGEYRRPEIPEGLSPNLFEIDFSDVVEALPQSGFITQSANYSLELLLSLSRTIFYGAYHLCKPVFTQPNFCSVSRDSCMRAVVYSACEIDPYILNVQLSTLLTPYFSEYALEALQIYGIGTASTPASVLSFLQTSD